MNKWTDQEKQILIDNYFKYGPYIKELSHRTSSAVMNAARKFKLYYDDPSVWKESEVEYLKENYNNLHIDLMCEKLNKTVKQIRDKAWKSGITEDCVRWTNEEIAILKECYEFNPIDYVVDKLNNKRTKFSIYIMANKLGLSYSLYKVDHNQFINVETKEIAYLLGLLWADGNLVKPGTIRHVFQENDFDSFKKVYDETGDWGVYSRKGFPHKSIWTSNKELLDYLWSIGYFPFNYGTAKPVLDTIPNHLKSYWFLGLIDGDGCFYFYDKTKEGKSYSRGFCLASGYDQDWSYFEDYLKELKVSSWKVRQSILKLGKGSCLWIHRKEDLRKLGNDVYKDKSFIPLQRKYLKWQQAIVDYS